MLAGGFDKAAFIKTACAQLGTPGERIACKEKLRKECPADATDEKACAAQFKALLEGTSNTTPTPPPPTPPPVAPPKPTAADLDLDLEEPIPAVKPATPSAPITPPTPQTSPAGIDPIVAALVPLLQHPDPKVRENVSLILSGINSKTIAPAMKPIVPLLMKLFREGDVATKMNIAQLLGAAGDDAVAIVPDFVKELHHWLEIQKQPTAPGPSYPREIIEGLTRIGSGITSAVPDLIRTLDNRVIRYAALLALEKIGPEAAAAVPGLMKLLQQKDLEIYERAKIADTLGAIGAKAAPALPLLKKLQNVPGSSWAVGDAIAKIEAANGKTKGK